MRFTFISIGKEHETYVKAGVEMFTKRIQNYYKAEWLLMSPPKNAASFSETELKKKEGEMVLGILEKDDYLVALDERGKMLSSEGLAQSIQTRANGSTRRMVFLIGGAFGLDEAVLKRADFKWSLSELVFPHQLVRLILSEQVYRACSILKNEKYHHK